MATPSLAMIPSAYADSKVYSVLPNNGDGDFTFNRDSSATRVGQNGLIQTVGYFGSELIVNGDFSNGGANWSYNVNHWSFSSGTADCNGTQTSLSYLNQSGAIVSGKVYKVTYEVTSITAGEIIVFVGDVSGVARTTAGVYTENITAASTNFWLRASSTFVGSIDNVSVQEVLGDQPRLNYDISNGVVQSCPSLLLEPASTNLVTYSTPINSSPYSYSGGGVGVAPTYTANAGISPDGTSTAVKLFFDINGGTTSSDLSQFAYTGSALTGDYTSSFYLKSSDSNSYTVTLLNTNGITSEAVITPEWQRFTLYNGGGTTSTNLIRIRLRGNENTSNTASLLAWGFQLENLAYATSLIPTAGSSQTRAAETCNGAGNASTFNDSEGTIYWEASALSDDFTDKRIFLSDGTMNNYVAIGYSRFAGNIIAEMISGGVLQTSSFGATGVTKTNNNKYALAWGSGTMKFYVNGTQTNTESVTSPTGLNVLEFNTAVDNLFMYSNTRDLRVYNEALTDAQLQTLTTL